MNFFRDEVKVGALAIVSLGMLAVLVFSVGKTKLFHKAHHYDVYFGFTNGLALNAPVHYVGVPVGRVEQITLLKKDQREQHHGAFVRVEMSVDADIEMKEDVKASVATLGLMGEKYIELMPFKDSVANVLKPGGAIYATDPVGMDTIMNKGVKIAEHLESILYSIDELVSDVKLKTAVRDIVYDMQSLISGSKEDVQVLISKLKKSAIQLETTLQTADGLLADNREDVRVLIENLKETSQFAKSFAKQIEANPSALVWKSRHSKKRELERKRKEAEKKHMSVDDNGRIVNKSDKDDLLRR